MDFMSKLSPAMRQVLEEGRRREEEQERQWEAECLRQEQRAQEHRKWIRLLEYNMEVFWETEGLYRFDPEGRISSQKLYSLYKAWCIQKDLPLKPPRAFFLYTKQHASQYRLVYSMNIPAENGKHVRGFYGVRELLPEEKEALPSSDTQQNADKEVNS